MSIEQISVHQAFERMQKDQAVYLDVRTDQEFAAGHAQGAVHMAVMTNNDGGQMVLVKDFVAQVQARFACDQNFVVGCRTGKRSQTACELLQAAGFLKLANIKGGFMGTPDDKGWRDAGLPVE